MDNHTPGPWKVVTPSAIDWRDPLIYGADGQSLVAFTYGGGPVRAIASPEQRANAALIALAPQMFAALEYVLELANVLPNTLEDVVSLVRPLVDEVKSFRGTPASFQKSDESFRETPACLPSHVSVLEACENLIGSVDNLVNESDGVYGLNLNGDYAPWSDLIAGGRYGEWLVDLETAREVVAKAKAGAV